MDPHADPRREELRHSLATLRDLPTPSAVLHEIWAVLDDQRASAASLASVLARDTALSARTLRLANSAYFGLPNPVSDVRAACVVLGFETVRALAVGVAALDGLSGAAGAVLDVDAFWRHSMCVGSAARELARKMGLPDTGTAFCGGMLHDMGRLVLAVARPDAYRELLASPDPASRERETAAFGAAHDEVGIWAAERWRFPAPLHDAIGLHHAPDGEGAWSRWGALVHVADAVTRQAGVPCLPAEDAARTAPAADSPPHDAALPDPAALVLLRIAPATLLALREHVENQRERIGALATAARTSS